MNKQKISGEIGIFVWKEPKPIDQREQRAFIPLDDFKHLLDIFNGVFPLENPIYSEDQSFDICGHNFIDCLTCQIIIKKIKELSMGAAPGSSSNPNPGSSANAGITTNNNIKIVITVLF